MVGLYRETTMILFKQDWLEYPDAIIDTQSRNKSFVRLATVYREMKIENYSFLLQLHNPDLIGVDPYDPDLTQEQQILIAIECKNNFFYYLRECVRVPGSSYDSPMYFKANRGNMALCWLFFNHVALLLIQPRQTGKSFSTDVLMTYLLNIRCTNTHINLLTKDDALRTANLERLKEIELELPPFLKQRGRGDIGNTEELSIKNLKNRYRGYLPNKSKKIAANVGRGLTAPIFHVDEIAFFYNIGITLPAALAAGTAARLSAEEKNEPFGTIFTTTAGKKDDVDGAYAYNILINSAIWTEKFLDSPDLPALELIVRTNSPKGELRVNCTFSHRQLGYTDAWMRKALEDSMSIGEDADRDFFNIWTSGSISSPIPTEYTTVIRESQNDDYYTAIASPYSYVTRWHVAETAITNYMNSSKFTMGMDTSDAAGGDDIALILRDIKTGGTVASGNYNETNLITFSEWLVNWLVKYETITLVIERRSTGAMIIDYLLLMLPARGIDPFRRIYNKVVQEADEAPGRFKEINKPMHLRSAELYVKYKKAFGFATSANGATSRTELYSSTLLNAVKHTASKVLDGKTIDQLLGLTVKNGRVDHVAGANDDLCISWLLSYWILIHGKNLNFYGIDSKDILVENELHMVEHTPLREYENREQQYLRGQIEQLVEEIAKERDDYIAIRLEQKLKMLASKLNSADQEVLSLDDLIGKLRDARRKQLHY